MALCAKKKFQVSFIAKIWKASIISQQEVRRRNCGDVDLGYLCVCLCMCARLWASQIIHTQLHWINFTDWKKNLGAIASVFVIFGKHCWCVCCESGKGVACERIIYWCVCVCVCMIMILAFWTNRSLRWILCSMIVLRSFRFYANELSLLNLFWSGSLGQILVNSYF